MSQTAVTPAPHVVRRGTGRPLVLIHGNGVDHRALLPLDDAFAELGEWERIYIDLPGFGGTPALPGAGGASEMAGWLLAFVRETLADRPFAVLGSSFGGLLARSLVADLPDQVLGMALLCPVVDPVQARRRLPDKTVIVHDEDLLDSFTEDDRAEYEPIAVLQTPDNWAQFQRFVLPGIRSVDPDAFARLNAAYSLPDKPEDRGGPVFARPSLIITGGQDHVVGFEDQSDLLAYYPRATYAVIDRAGHNAHMDQPEIVQGLLRDWARRLPSIT